MFYLLSHLYLEKTTATFYILLVVQIVENTTLLDVLVPQYFLESKDFKQVKSSIPDRVLYYRLLLSEPTFIQSDIMSYKQYLMKFVGILY